MLQGARAARGSPQLGTRLCDVERGGSNGNKIEKAAAAAPTTTSSMSNASAAAAMSPSNLNRVTIFEIGFLRIFKVIRLFS